MIETIPCTSSLSERLREHIKRNGPLSFHDWMKAALYDASDGYYCRRDRTRWGREGDYRTSPERSSLFAATFARYFARLHDQLNQPARWTIAEVGAGNGQFAREVLQTLKTHFPAVFAATQYVIDEISPHSQTTLAERLKPFIDRVEFSTLDKIAIDAGIIFSNELLDAFPVHRITMVDGKRREFFVDVGPEGNFEWSIGLPTPGVVEHLEEAGIELKEGQVAEINIEIATWLKTVSTTLRAGYAVTVDYGAAADDLYSLVARPSGTLRGFRKHTIVENVLARPGEQDLTTTVDWTFVERTGNKLQLPVVDFDRLDKFLMRAGLLTQLDSELQKCAGEAEKVKLSTAARDMVLPDGMASHFQVMVQQKSPW